MADMEIAITATKREALGKRVKGLRQAGKLPGVLYGHNVSNQALEINEKDFTKAFKNAGESTIVNLVVDGKTQPVLIHEVQNHYLTGQPIHVDFYAVNMTEKIKVKVPLHFIGESAAVKALGGTLVKNLAEVEVECLPGDLPHSFEVDISALNTFEDAIRVSDIKISDKVAIVGSPDEVAVTVAPPRSEEEMKALEEAPVAEDVTKVEGVIKPEAKTENGEEDQEKKSKKE
ncbi:MAG TPA: 50S ribosomal protein L25 [Methylomirabilota bacterium]|nr:50S ribosomal protein L25 [Methylomirabilota bacterium]